MKIINKQMDRIYELIKGGYKITFSGDELNEQQMIIDMRKGLKRKYIIVPFKSVDDFGENAIKLAIETLIERINGVKYHKKNEIPRSEEAV